MAAGSIAKVSGSGQSIPSTSFAVLDLGTIDTDPDSIQQRQVDSKRPTTTVSTFSGVGD